MPPELVQSRRCLLFPAKRVSGVSAVRRLREIPHSQASVIEEDFRMKRTVRNHVATLLILIGVWIAGTTVLSAEPRVQLKLAAFPGLTFPNFSVLAIPAASQGALEIWLEDAQTEVKLSSVRVSLNEVPMTPFVTTNALPRGCRTIIRMGATLSPEYSLRPGENLFSFTASDNLNNIYTARFYVTLDSKATAPQLIASRDTTPAGVLPPPMHTGPVVKFTSDWPERTDSRSLMLAADVTDVDGIQRVVIEVNGKDVEAAQIQNGQIVRSKDGFIASAKLPGEIGGDAKHLSINVPVQLDKTITVVAVRVESALGLRTRVDRVVTLGGTGTSTATTGGSSRPPAATTPSPAVPAPAGLPAFSSLAFDLQLITAKGNKTLEGGERFDLRVNVKNGGTGPANNVEVRLAGDPVIVQATGPKQSAGNIAPGQTRTVDFSGVMPVKVEPRNADVVISLAEGPSELPQTQLLRIGLVPADVRQTTTVLSEVIDVDYPPAAVSIPERASSVAVVIGISAYRETVIPKLPYAGRDAEMFARYLESIGGVRKENIQHLSDEHAGRIDIEDAVENWLPRHVMPGSHVYFYYAGHGALNPETGETYLVPYEGTPDSPIRLYPLKRLYEKLGELKVQNVTVFLDSCFSGGGRSIAMKGRPIVINADTPRSTNIPNVTVLAAAGGNQVSSDYERNRHGLFTYFLLKGMRGEADTSRDGWIDVDELFSFVREKVRTTAITELNREQTPVLTGGPDLDAKKGVKLFKIQK
jgi:hypothetical protein